MTDELLEWPKELARGQHWRACEALLTVHAIADEACAGLGVAGRRGVRVHVRWPEMARDLINSRGMLGRVPCRSHDARA